MVAKEAEMRKEEIEKEIEKVKMGRRVNEDE